MTLPEGVERWEDLRSLGAPMPDVAVGPDDDATILYTSGTTGHPKGAVSTHRAVVHALMGFGCRAALDRLRREDAPDGRAEVARPVFILIVPLFHVTGSVPVMLSCFSSGLTLVMMYKWDPDRALELIERERVTNFVGVPTQSFDLLESPRFAATDTSSLISIGGGGAPAPPELVKRVARSFRSGGPSIGYGMTETNAYGPGNNGQDYVTHPTSTGRSTPILDLAVRDPDGHDLPIGERGEIWFKGPHLIRGYWNQPEATAETIVDGWLRSGDLGRVDDEGFVYVEDRAKDMVLRAGENVYCAEVEAAIYELPEVLEAAVFGIPHQRLGEEVAAAVYLRPGRVAHRGRAPGPCRPSGWPRSRCPRSCRSSTSRCPATRRASSSSGTCATRSAEGGEAPLDVRAGQALDRAGAGGGRDATAAGRVHGVVAHGLQHLVVGLEGHHGGALAAEAADLAVEQRGPTSAASAGRRPGAGGAPGGTWAS